MNARTIIALVAGLLWVANAWPSSPALAQGNAMRPPARLELRPIGKVQSVTGSVTIEHTNAVVLQANLPGGGWQTKVEDPIYLNDVIQTGPDGTVGIIFGDGTAFIASKNARMEVNEFIYDPRSTSNSTWFNLTKGTFTLLAGMSAKSGNMRVETPVGTMGIRGTAPHVEIVDDATVKFTTLIEENKDAAVRPVPERRAQVSPQSFAGQRNWHRILTICRGC